MKLCSGVFPEKQRRWSELEDKLTYPVKSPIVLGVLSLVNLADTGSEKKKSAAGQSSLQDRDEDDAPIDNR